MKKQIQQTFCILTGMFALSVSNLKAEEKNIMDTVAAAENFKILVEVLKLNGLDKELKGRGQLTLFAPNDLAFKKLPKEVLQKLMKPENKEYLIRMLKYHIVAGRVSGSEAITLKEVETLHGEKINVQFKNASMYLNESRVKASDIKASNGVINVIDTLLVPTKIKVPKSSEIEKQALLGN